MIGNGLRSDIKIRCESLEALSLICTRLRSDISFRAPPVAELTAKYSTEGKCALLFAEVTENMEKGFCEAWLKSAAKWAKASGLTKEETETVLMLRTLGSADIEGEKTLLTAVEDRLRMHAESAEKELLTKGKMLFSCSMLGGLALVILII